MKRKVRKKVEKQSKNKLVAGIDLGGTTCTIVIVNELGKIKAEKQFVTGADKGPDYVINNIAMNTREVVLKAGLTMKQIWRIGIGSPGPLNSKKGIIMGAVNLPGWNYVRLKSKLEKLLKVKIAVDNDANCAAYGEKWTGAAKNLNDVVAITLGTGIGGGIIIGGRLVRGANFNAAEIGHISLNPDGRVCNCKAKGCFERYSSASAIAGTARERIRKGEKSIITEIVKGRLNHITSEIIYDAYVSGDKLAISVWNEFIKYLGAGIANVMNFLDPEMIVISGGVINAGEKLFKPLKKAVKAQSFDLTFNSVKIVPAKLGQKAGAIGAAGLAIFEGDYYNL